MCRYNMTRFAICLNEMTSGLKEKLAPTDSRLRPDQHALEEGIFDQVFFCRQCLLLFSRKLLLPCTSRLAILVLAKSNAPPLPWGLGDARDVIASPAMLPSYLLSVRVTCYA